MFLIRRTIDGDWWFYPEKVYEGMIGEPRAYGTMTTLRSGRIIAPFANVIHEMDTAVMRILNSDDNGQSFRTGPPINVDPLYWATPYGRPFEIDGQIIMPVFGAYSPQDLKATRLCCGLLRSSDGGRTWGEWSLIVEPGPSPDRTGQASYEFPAVLPLSEAGDDMVAILTARQLSRRPQLSLDIPQTLVRCYSTDAGCTWTDPEQLCVGSWASLTRMDAQTLACSFAIWAGWGEMNVMFSHDGFRSIRHCIPYVEHNWLPNLPPHSKSGWGRGWARDPLPMPPVVPYLDGDWDVGHYGFASGLAIDRDHLLLVLGQRQAGTSYSDPPHEVDLPIETECVETIEIKRLPYGRGQPAALLRNHGSIQGQWYMAETWPVEKWSQLVSQPPKGVSIVMESGRWVKVAATQPTEITEGTRCLIGREKGYWVWKTLDGLSYHTAMVCSFSDDEGKTWQQARIDQPVPLAAAVHPGASVFVEPNGTIVAPVYGYLNKEDMSVSLYVSALIRSHDCGESWGDWSIIGYDRRGRSAAYSETEVIPIPDGTWVAFLRTEHRNHVPHVRALYARSVSRDRGRTWSPPEPSATSGVCARTLLPDGAIAQSSQNTCGWGVGISYNYGRTWNYILPATYANSRAGVIDDKTFWLYDEEVKMVTIYRRD